MRPGEILTGEGALELLADRERRHLRVRNLGDRPVQVGSHYHFAEANPALDFDRAAAWGMRLAVPAGTSVRFEPGVEADVTLIALGGRRRVPGLRAVAGGPLDEGDPRARLAASGLAEARPGASSTVRASRPSETADETPEETT
jgi:urease subunit beta